MKSTKQVAVGSVLTLAILGSLVACNDNAPGMAASAASAPVSGAAASTDYVQSAQLVAYHAGDALDDGRSNRVTINGQGANSTYRVQYHFNSGGSTELKIMEMTTSSTPSGCALPQTRVVLKQGEASQDVFVAGKIELTQYTDYTLEVRQDQNCEALELTVNLMAWMSTAPSQDPYLAKECLGQRGEVFTFFPINGVIGFSSSRNGKEFVGGGEYCGENFNQFSPECVSDSRSFGKFADFARCYSGEVGNDRDFVLNFDEAHGGIVSCEKNEHFVFSEKLSNCVDAILDLNQYKRQN